MQDKNIRNEIVAKHGMGERWIYNHVRNREAFDGRIGSDVLIYQAHVSRSARNPASDAIAETIQKDLASLINNLKAQHQAMEEVVNMQATEAHLRDRLKALLESGTVETVAA